MWHIKRKFVKAYTRKEKQRALEYQADMVFRSIDTNNDGKLDLDELTSAIKTNRGLARLFNKRSLAIGDFIPQSLDADRDGAISFSEFMQAVAAESEAADESTLLEATAAAEMEI